MARDTDIVVAKDVTITVRRDMMDHLPPLAVYMLMIVVRSPAAALSVIGLFPELD